MAFGCFPVLHNSSTFLCVSRTELLLLTEGSALSAPAGSGIMLQPLMLQDAVRQSFVPACSPATPSPVMLVLTVHKGSSHACLTKKQP